MPELRNALPAMRRDDGVAALVVAFLFSASVFVTLLALVIDVGVARVERRELQNGATAAAMRAAFDCSLDGVGTHVCGSTTGLVSTASLNAQDRSESVTSTALCGAGNAKLAACTLPRTITNCPSAPTSAQWTQVTTSTWSSGGSPYLPTFFSKAIPGLSNKTITACAQAAWGPPGQLPLQLAVALSAGCFASHPPASSQPPYGSETAESTATSSYASEFAVVLNPSSSSSDTCTAAGTGGFGWLVGDATCNITLTYNDSSTATDFSKPGASTPAGCESSLTKVLNVLPKDASASKGWTAGFDKTVSVAVFDQYTGTGSGLQYHIVGFASFYLTGWAKLPGTSGSDPPSRKASCGSGDKCLFGWFVKSTVSPAHYVPAGAGQQNYGLNVVGLVG